GGAVMRPFKTPRDVLAWINFYREEPTPAHVPAAIRAMSALGLFRDLERAGIYLGFFAGVLADNQLKAPELIAQTFPLRPEDQVVIIRGIVDSGLPNWKALLGQFTERMPARQILIRSYLYGKSKPLAALKLDKGPAVLDAHWGMYFATGRYDPILSILTALTWVDEDTDLERLTIAGMASWTLANNASRDKHLLDFLRAETYRQPKPIAAALRKIVTASETFETASLRKEATEKIQKLKAKGPPRKRGWAWWSEAAGTVVAIGCVAAGAAGQVALGLPCIIGGTLTSAATRFLRLEETRQK
ncbi:MAG: hypothetical protein AAFR55_02610, partial [Pseudomonadota bacterium]